MTRLITFLVGGWFLATWTAGGAETARARLYCLSLRFQEGSSSDGNFKLDLSSLDPSTTINGELAPDFDPSSPYSHFSFFKMEDPTALEPIFGVIAFDVPSGPDPDLNGNGFPDFFEVGRPVSGSTDGAYFIPDGMGGAFDQGSVQASWSRAAGSKDGACKLRLRSQMVGLLPELVHAFELIEYKGPLSYSPDTNSVSGTINLTQTGAPSEQLTGPILLLKSATNRFNKLELQPDAWTNAAGQTLSYTNDVIDRDLTRPTNYFGFVDFLDGDPNTANDPDYLTWFLSIDDPNDSNGNRVPDFSDDVGSTTPRAPSLALARGSAELLLRISGTVGRAHEIQRIDSLSRTNWTTVSILTLTSDPQTVPLPLPTNAILFWRVRVP